MMRTLIVSRWKQRRRVPGAADRTELLLETVDVFGDGPRNFEDDRRRHLHSANHPHRHLWRTGFGVVAGHTHDGKVEGEFVLGVPDTDKVGVHPAFDLGWDVYDQLHFMFGTHPLIVSYGLGMRTSTSK